MTTTKSVPYEVESIFNNLEQLQKEAAANGLNLSLQYRLADSLRTTDPKGVKTLVQLLRGKHFTKAQRGIAASYVEKILKAEIKQHYHSLTNQELAAQRPDHRGYWREALWEEVMFERYAEIYGHEENQKLLDRPDAIEIMLAIYQG